ncbi:MAG TPA: hypothetical protein VGJ66_04400 [Pyrinomonadaceae bacterium]|jgi:hypothetical protein
MTSSSKPPHAHSIEEAIHSTVELSELMDISNDDSNRGGSSRTLL